ncbi:MAG: hypothetical protein K2Q09_03060 [Phycisphaerales bacterium]|nr:hypothetical protein [Phycisphaerales bacterium]
MSHAVERQVHAVRRSHGAVSDFYHTVRAVDGPLMPEEGEAPSSGTSIP